MKIRILSEDGSAYAVPALQHLIKRMLAFAFPSLDTSKVVWLPRDVAHSAVMSGNKWRSTKAADRRAITELLKFMATEIRIENQFVFFHFDGDQPWSTRSDAGTPRQFGDRIVEKIGMINPGFDRNKLIEVTPFYAIEAWLYQNTEHCRVHAPLAMHQSLLAEWERTPGSLDELVKPHESLPFGRKQNADLSEKFTKAQVKKTFEAQKSMHAFLGSLRANKTLLKAVQQTK
jgi:hypothetical protein